MERRVLILTRDLRRPDGHFGTFSELDTGRGRYKFLERPKPGLVGDHPCIPPTDRGYDMDWTTNHPHHPGCYEIQVPGRTAILVHTANWFQQLLGCLAPGLEIAEVVDEDGHVLGSPGAKQVGVVGSKLALLALVEDLDRAPCRLVIREILPS